MAAARRDLTIDARPALRPAVAAAADQPRHEQRVAACRRRLRARRRQDRRPRERRHLLRSHPAARDVERASSATARSTRPRCSRSDRPARRCGPNVLPAFPAGVLVSISNINPDVQNQYNQQAGVQVERALGSCALGAGRLLVRPRPRHPDVAQRQRADADGRAGRAARRRQPRAAEPELRQHQPVRRARRRVVQRADAVARDAPRAVGRRARLLHAVERGRRCRQRVLSDAADAERHPRGQGAVGQRSASPARGQRHARRRIERGGSAGAGRHADRLGLLVRHGAAVQRRHGRRQQQRHDRQRSAGRRRPQLRADAVLRRSRRRRAARATFDMRISRDVLVLGHEPARADARRVQPVQPRERRQREQHDRQRRDAVARRFSR